MPASFLKDIHSWSKIQFPKGFRCDSDSEKRAGAVSGMLGLILSIPSGFSGRWVASELVW
jgi:hypothetical protein